jgi:predicted dienelactone hydrolase
MKISAVAAAVLLSCNARAAVGFEQVNFPDPPGKPLTVGIWYPSDDSPSPQALALFTQTVAVQGRISGERLPLILISHGNGGNLASHYDTALALARAGFIAVAVTHTGDNSSDQSYAGNLIDLTDRPRQIKQVLDAMLSTWRGRDRIDSSRIGIFGFSLGGFTALVEIGGEPNLQRFGSTCAVKPDAPECQFVKQRHGDQLESVRAKPAWVHDSRIKAAVVAAPAMSLLFQAGGVRQIKVPVQMWRATKDEQVPDLWNTAFLREELGSLTSEELVRGAGHYVFLAPCSEALAKAVPQICEDPPGVNRTAFHRELDSAIIAFFRKELKFQPMAPK